MWNLNESEGRKAKVNAAAPRHNWIMKGKKVEKKGLMHDYEKLSRWDNRLKRGQYSDM